MQPSTPQGRKTRLMLLPISWAVAGVIVCTIIAGLAKVNGSSIKELLAPNDLWPLAVFLPGLLMGKFIGMMATNKLAHTIPTLRQRFEEERATTGRQNYSAAMSGMAKAAAILAALTLLGGFLLLQHR